jgi:ankyrin repeat protein
LELSFLLALCPDNWYAPLVFSTYCALVGSLAGWLVGWLVGWFAGWLVSHIDQCTCDADSLRILLELLDFAKSLFRLVKKRHFIKVPHAEYQDQSARRIITDRKRAIVKNHDTKEPTVLVKEAEPFVQYLVHLLAAQVKPTLITKQYSNGNSILHYLAWLGLEAPLSYVIERVDVDASNINGVTALHAAASQGYKQIVERLLRRKVNGSALDHCGQSPSNYASHCGFAEVATMLDVYTVNRSTSSGTLDETTHVSLSTAAFSGNVDATRQLIAAGHCVNAPDANGAAPLLLASLYGHTEVTQLLLEANAEPDKRDEDGTTALHKATYAGQNDIVTLLLQHNADPNLPNRSGALPLHIAAYKNRLECAKSLIDAKSQIDLPDDHGITPVHQACIQDNVALVKLLVAHSADISIPDNEGSTALQTCCHGGRAESARVLIGCGASTSDASLLHHVSFFGYADCLAILLPFFNDNPEAINNSDNEGSTPLHKASFNGHQPCVSFLLKHGASVSAVDEEGASPLHQASFNGHTECAAALIQEGAQVDLVDNAEGTPLHNACFNGHPGVVEVLGSFIANALPNINQSTNQPTIVIGTRVSLALVTIRCRCLTT